MSVLSSRQQGRRGGGGGGGGPSPSSSSTPAPSFLGSAAAASLSHSHGPLSSGGSGGAAALDEHAAIGGDYSGWLIKAAPHVTDDDKEDSLSRRFRRFGNSLLSLLLNTPRYKRRFFVLDSHELRYYRDEGLATLSGTLDLGTVLQVRWAERAGVPAFAFDLVTDARTFTLAPSPASETAAGEWFKWL